MIRPVPKKIITTKERILIKIWIIIVCIHGQQCCDHHCYCFLFSFLSVKRRWKSMVGSPCGLATDSNPLKTMEMAFCYSSLLQHTQSGTYTCVLTYWTHTNFSNHWLLRREIAIGVRQGFNWSWSQFNVRQGLAVIGRREEGVGGGFGEEISQSLTLKPAALNERNSVMWPTKMWECCWESANRKLDWRDEWHQAKLNPNFPVTVWARSWLFLALCGARDRAVARVWPVLFKSTTCY